VSSFVSGMALEIVLDRNGDCVVHTSKVDRRRWTNARDFRVFLARIVHMKFDPIRKGKTIVHMVVDQILTHVATGKLKPGDVLPVETELARTFKIGKSTIREALRILETRDVVEIVPRKGIIIRSIPENLLDPGDIHLRLELGRRHLPDLVDFLVVTFGGGAGLACQARTATDLKKLDSILREIGKCADLIINGKANRKTYKRYGDLYLQFYSYLGKSTHNIIYTETMDALLNNLSDHLPLAEIIVTQEITSIRPTLSLDQELVRALERRDSEKVGELAGKRARQIRRMLLEAMALQPSRST
jgi:GntR family transcriptional repressor for pyruvate dehydrogenase complex